MVVAQVMVVKIVKTPLIMVQVPTATRTSSLWRRSRLTTYRIILKATCIVIWQQASSLRSQLTRGNPSNKLLKTYREDSQLPNSILMARTTYTGKQSIKCFHPVLLPLRQIEEPHHISSALVWSYSSSSMMMTRMLKNRFKVANKVQTRLRVDKKKDWFLIRNRSMEIN